MVRILRQKKGHIFPVLSPFSSTLCFYRISLFPQVPLPPPHHCCHHHHKTNHYHTIQLSYPRCIYKYIPSLRRVDRKTFISFRWKKEHMRFVRHKANTYCSMHVLHIVLNFFFHLHMHPNFTSHHQLAILYFCREEHQDHIESYPFAVVQQASNATIF